MKKQILWCFGSPRACNLRPYSEAKSASMRWVAGRAIGCSLIYFSTVSLVWARPPSEIKAEYSLMGQILKVEVLHTTSNQREHHIRKIVIFRNGEEVESFYFVKQTSATALLKETPLAAKPKDVLRIKAICSEAGFKEQEIVVPDPPALSENP